MPLPEPRPNAVKTPDFAVWQSRQHFDFGDPWEHVEFAVYSTFDVVARPGWRITNPRQTHNELWIVREGSVEIAQDGQSALAQSPCVALVRAGKSRDTEQRGSGALSILGFSFGATLWGALDFLESLPLEPVLPTPSPRLEELVMRMVEEARDSKVGYSLAVQGLGQLALVEIWRGLGVEESHPSQRLLQMAQYGELSDALKLVQTRLHEPLDVEQMAQAAHLSTKYFGRKFHAALGLPPMEYVRRVRLNRARDLLASSDAPVSTIARQCGFEDDAHFSRAFKTQWGASPLEFRRNLREMMRTS